MAATNLNTVRSTIESRIRNEFRTGQPIPIVFNNVPFDATNVDQYIQCTLSFGSSEYLTQQAPNSSTTSTNLVVGLVTCNIYTKQGLGAGANFTIGKRVRDLFNRITVSNVRFDPPVGPEVSEAIPEGKFQTQVRITFELYEALVP
tara:strand:- start:572 stop:1009 length:438 start_codon:yes stop_codon:yes gene_type:complete